MNRSNTSITIANLSVAVVLVGALAFIVVYKLFAVDAKVKASEVILQAGQWNKLLVAHAIENEDLGSFAEIGYVPPGKLSEGGENSKSRYFKYSSDLDNGKGRFLAVNTVSFNECRKYEGKWFAYGNPEQIVGNAVAEAPVARCATLTPFFELLRGYH
ncbi:MAG: hypothetical protein FWB90_03765 [Fibromonadales bacterium]|nr:hypothetical protein [Fibromonadales bacterium]